MVLHLYFIFQTASTMMTRKLSEIGTLVKPDPDSATQFEPFVQMTMEERREFAKELLRRYEAYKWNTQFANISARRMKGDTLSFSEDDFLDKEGL